MSKIFTDVEQSKKLIELGIDKNTADMRIGNYVGKSGKVDGTNLHYYTKEESFGAPEIIPCWSLSALLDLIPPYLGDFDEGIDFGLSKSMNGKWYSAHYLQPCILDGSTISIKTVTGETAIDACVEMICWLKENKKI